MRGDSDHVSISPERDSAPRGSACGLWPGSERSWRGPPQIRVSLQLLAAVLLVCLGLLLGTAWTTQALQPKLRHQAEERRRLNEEWLALRAVRQRHGECPSCGGPLHWHSAPTVVEDRPDDD